MDSSARGRARADAQGRGDDGAGSEECIGIQPSGGGVDLDVVLLRGVGLEVTDAMPAPPATCPTPSAVVAATFFTVIPLLLMMFLPLQSFETISN